MKVQNSIIGLLLVIALVASVVLISFINKSPMQEKDPSEYRIEVILKSIDYEGIPFWNVVRQGLITAAEDLNVQIAINGPYSETEIDKQIELVATALERKPDAIILAAADYTRLIPAAESITAEDIPLITIDSFIDSEDPDTRIGTDNYAAGWKAGLIIQDNVERGAKIAVISYVKESSTAIDRERGVRDSLEGYAEIIGTWYSGGDIDIARMQTNEVLNNFPDIHALVALNEPSTVGCADSLAISGRLSDITLIGFDNSSPIIQYLEQGVIQAIIVQKPFNMGYLGVSHAVDVIKGKSIPDVVDTGSEIITRETMYTSENQKLLFPLNR